MKTKITEYLDAHNVPYKVLRHAEPVYTVEKAAAQRGVILEEMVKSILLRDKKGHYVMACVRGDMRLNPKAVRAYVPDHWKRLSFASREQIRAVTGYIQGAVAPLCLPEDVPVVMDEALARCDKLNTSSGDPMAGLELATEDMLRLTNARLAPIAEPE